ncbi:hypothetical protein [Duganella qianjiadongensis]|uniref:Uncharacterized protein n=1 Tax=Duganella qianjiadongensis TaxID=2692176 RepID=A0ABW9VR59_9BURK|nr:hypothetical protein [Duganella qianjiadongensis]MYM41167.1 hypothetical protein [Duganella qianjiadongensis]
MGDACANFVNELVTLHPSLAEKLIEVREYWAPDEPPITILFGEIGRQITSEFVYNPENIGRDVFNLINAGMAGDGLLLTAIATGLIESVVSNIKDESVREIFLGQLGEKAQAHARAWIGK